MQEFSSPTSPYCARTAYSAHAGMGSTTKGRRLEFCRRSRYSGCLVKLLREAMDFVDRHNRVAWTKTDDDRIETPSYVMRAVEEALVNALIHRRYEIGRR